MTVRNLKHEIFLLLRQYIDECDRLETAAEQKLQQQQQQQQQQQGGAQSPPYTGRGGMHV